MPIADRCAIPASLHPPQAALRRRCPTRSACRGLTPVATKKERQADACLSFLAGAERLGLGCRLGRLVACVPPARTRPTTRTAGEPAGAPRCQILPHTNEKSQVPQKRYLTFLAGAEGLEPSARGFGVDVGTDHSEQGRADVAQFSQPSLKRAVLIWCCERIFEGKNRKTGEKI